MTRLICVLMVMSPFIILIGAKYNSRYDYDYPQYVNVEPQYYPPTLKAVPRKRFFGLDIPDYVTDDDRPRHVRDIIKRMQTMG